MRPDPALPPLATVKREWVDHYGHMNLAWYLSVFDLQTDVLWPTLGLGDPFRARGLGTFAAETWVRYAREVLEGMPLACTSEVLDHDAKRLLILHRMFHHGEGWLAAENEVLYLSVDLGARRVVPWPPEVLERFAAARTGTPARRLPLRPTDLPR